MSKLTVILENGSLINIDEPVSTARLRSSLKESNKSPQETKEIVFNSTRTTDRTSAKVSKLSGAKENESKGRNVPSKPTEEMHNEVVKVWTNELSSVLFTPMDFESKLTNTTPSISKEPSLDAVCTHLFEDSHSLVFPDKTDLDPFNITLVDPDLAEYFEPMDQVEDLYGWNGYADNCRKYLTPIINQFKPCVEKDAHDIILDNYGITSLRIGQLLDVLRSLIPPAHIFNINLQNNPITASGCKSISVFLSETDKIQTLNLSFCRLTSRGAEYLMTGIEGTKSLKELKLNNCDLRDLGGASVATAMTKNLTIKILDLRSNNLSCQTAEKLGRMLAKNTTLEILLLNWNFLYSQPDSFVKFSKGLAKNKSLKSLGLAWNGGYGDHFLKRMLIAMKKSRVEILNLEGNRLGERDVKGLIKIMTVPKSLKEIYLDCNYLTDPDFATILKALTPNYKSQLSVLSFGKTYISKETAMRIDEVHKLHRNLKIIFQGIARNIPANEVDVKSLVLNRCKFVAQNRKNRRQRRNMGHVMHWILDDERPRVRPEEVETLILHIFRAKLDADLMTSLLEAFRYIEPKDPDEPKKKRRRKKNLIDWHEMANLYLTLHPTARGQMKRRKLSVIDKKAKGKKVQKGENKKH